MYSEPWHRGIFRTLSNIYDEVFYSEPLSLAYLDTPNTFETYSELKTFKILKILKIQFMQNHVYLWHIHDPCIFKPLYIQYTETCQTCMTGFSAELCVTLVFSQLEAYSEPCQIFMMENVIPNLVWPQHI